MKRFFKRVVYRVNSFLYYFKPANLAREAAKLGKSFSLRNLIIAGLTAIGAVVLVGYLLRVSYEGLIFLGMLTLAVTPFTWLHQAAYAYQISRFNDVVNYMEQMIYSFHKNNKVLSSLEDVYTVAKGNMRDIIAKMIEIIQKDNSGDNVYIKAFDYMSRHYNCYRLVTLHQYLVDIESNGGKSDRSLNILLEDIREWAERINAAQTQRKNARMNIILSVIGAIGCCAFMVLMLPEDMLSVMTDSPLYQIMTTGVCAACILIVMYATKRIGMSYLDNEVDMDSTKAAIKATEFIAEYEHKDHVKPGIIKACITLPAVVLCVWFDEYEILFVLIAVAFYLIFKDTWKKNSCVKDVQREVVKMFPVWIRSLILYLQTDNVRVALKRSLEFCPDILKAEVRTLLEHLSEDPNSTKPYEAFLSVYDLPNMKLAVNYIYSISQFGTADMFTQLDYLVKQNARLTAEEEKIRQEDSLALFQAMTFIPMILGSFKLIVDLLLYVSHFLGTVGGLL